MASNDHARSEPFTQTFFDYIEFYFHPYTSAFNQVEANL